MTCIVGLVHEGGVLLGGDTAGSAGWATAHRTDTKTAGLAWPPIERAGAALKAAEHHSNGVGGPFTFEDTGGGA